MALNIGEQVFYYYAQTDYATSFGNPGVAFVTAISPDDGTYTLMVCPANASYVVSRSKVTEGTGPGQATATPPPPPGKLDLPGRGDGTKSK